MKRRLWYVTRETYLMLYNQVNTGLMSCIKSIGFKNTHVSMFNKKDYAIRLCLREKKYCVQFMLT
eukprot:GAHX01005153.1.p1 GENE.GAHX01005153.1~~GAHX01005153.1.p1  ORF type:complete len:65 (+),score=5.27 GAHX01005153.1:101-295(+)